MLRVTIKCINLDSLTPVQPKNAKTCTFGDLHIWSLAHLETCTFGDLYIWRLAHLETCTFADLHIADLHIFTLAHLYNCTFAHLHILTLHVWELDFNQAGDEFLAPIGMRTYSK